MKDKKLNHNINEPKMVGGMIAGPTPSVKAKETLRLLKEGNHEELKRRAKEAWDRALENARKHRDYEE